MTVAWLLWLFLSISYDLTQRREPNWLVSTGATLALTSIHFGWQPFDIGWGIAIAGALAGFCVLLVFYLLRLMGAGDVKFAGALGLWVGVTPLFPIWVGASLLAGIHAGLWLLLQRWPVWPRLFVALSGKEGREGETGKRSRQIPYAAYLAISAIGWYALYGGQGTPN